MEKQVVRTEAAPAPFQGAPYNQAIVAGDFVFVAGQLGLKPGDTAVEGDITQQTEQVLANLESTPIVPGHRCPASATHPYRAPQGDDMRHQTFWIVALTKR